MKRVALFVSLAVLRTYSAYPQVSSGTVIIVNSSDDKLVVAADSRGIPSNSELPPDDSQCKLAALNHDVLFATGGHAVLTNFVGAWRNIDIAGIAVGSVDKALQGQEKVDDIAKKWAALLRDKWVDFYFKNPLAVIKSANESSNLITFGLFAGAWKGVIYKQVAAVAFVPGKTPPIDVASLSVPCWPCGQKSSGTLCALGQIYVAQELCSQGTPEWHPAGRFDPLASLAIYVVRETSLHDTSKTVGGPTHALELTKEGRLRWLADPNHCL